MNNDFILIICGFLGVITQCLIKCDSLLRDARASNANFHWKKDYVQRDAIPIMLAVLSVFIWYMLYGEAAGKYPAIIGKIRISFFCAGAVGSFAIQYALGKAKSRIRSVVDRKTDELDRMKGTVGEKTAL